MASTATITRFIINFKQRHPDRPERTAIDYETVFVTMPSVFLGSLLGVFVNKMLPEIAKVILFSVTLAWSIQTTYVKAKLIAKKEKKL